MEGQTQGKVEFPPFMQRILDRGIREGKLTNKRETLLRLVSRTGIVLTDEQRARIEACTDPAILDGWVDSVLGAKTAADVFG